MKIKYILNLREFFNPYFNSVYCKTFENDVISENCYGYFDYKGRKKIGRIYDMEVLKDVLGKEIDMIINDNKVDIDEYKNINGLDERDNIYSSTLPCEIHLKYSPIYKGGII